MLSAELKHDQPVLWEILVLSHWGENEIPVPYHQIWDEGVREISGGLTILKRAKGQWVSPQQELFIEPMIPVRIFCPRSAISLISDLTALHYAQKAVMYYRISDEVVIKHYE